MVAKVYTPAEVAEILRITNQDVLMLINRGDLKAFPVLGQARVSDQALEEFMRMPYNGSTTRPEKKVRAQRNRNLELERAGKERMMSKIRAVAPNVELVDGQTCFLANGNQLIAKVATKPDRRGHWFGFRDEWLHSGRPTFLILDLADRGIDLVIPCEKFQAEIGGLSVSKGERKFHIQSKGESYYLDGTGIEQYAIILDSYVNAFHLLR